MRLTIYGFQGHKLSTKHQDFVEFLISQYKFEEFTIKHVFDWRKTELYWLASSKTSPYLVVGAILLSPQVKKLSQETVSLVQDKQKSCLANLLMQLAL